MSRTFEIVVPDTLVVCAMRAFNKTWRVTKRELCEAAGVKSTANNGKSIVDELKKRGLIEDAGVKPDPRNGVLRDAYRKAK